ncbi:MAG: envelope stress response membrane protein PspB [Haliea sp.]
MQFWQFMFVPTILFLVIVAPIWITMHYRSVNRSSRSLNEEDRQALEELLATVDRLTERIGVLETILDSDHANWRDQTDRQRRGKEYDQE